LKASDGRTSAARLPLKKKKLYVTTSHKASSYPLGYDAADMPSIASRKLADTLEIESFDI